MTTEDRSYIKISTPQWNLNMLPVSNHMSIPPKTAGVYALYNQVQLVIYVGKAENLRGRIRDHAAANTNTKSFSHMFQFFSCFYETSAVYRDILETWLINELKPTHNSDKVWTYTSELMQLKKRKNDEEFARLHERAKIKQKEKELELARSTNKSESGVIASFDDIIPVYDFEHLKKANLLIEPVLVYFTKKNGKKSVCSENTMLKGILPSDMAVYYEQKWKDPPIQPFATWDIDKEIEKFHHQMTNYWGINVKLDNQNKFETMRNIWHIHATAETLQCNTSVIATYMEHNNGQIPKSKSDVHWYRKGIC